MITEKHLLHWLQEIEYQLTSIRNEILESKIPTTSIMVDGNCVSFEYLGEKSNIINQLLANLRFDNVYDGNLK